MRCNRSKPGPYGHLPFATNPVLRNFVGKLIIFIKFEILVPHYSEGGNLFGN